MSLFKRKQSKDKDVAAAPAANAPAANGGGTPGNSPPVNTAPSMNGINGGMPSRSQSTGQFAPPLPGPGQPQGQGTPPMANGRRMTSGNAQMPGANGPPAGPPNTTYQAPLPSQIYDSPNGSSYQSHQSRGPSSASGTDRDRMSTAASVSSESRPSNTFPWSTRPLQLYAPSRSPPVKPLSPFPRYGLSVPPYPSHSGHMLLFGGLVHDHVRNDLWSMDIRDCMTMPVKTKGDAPVPRVGHSSAIADRIMLVWGGDTKVDEKDPQDEGLYILDLRTQEWTSVPVRPGPIGRYGHAACMIDTKFYIFGGQAEGAAFMNDLWCYDIRQLEGDSHNWECIQYNSPAPPRRTGHIMVSYKGILLLFGGTDGNYHYNDTWTFDPSTGVWTELSCIGYIPQAREGHAAAVVDDDVYIFGGRDVNGKDLGDLAAFRMTNSRWYMFQNMGPAPTPRSGHSLVAAHGKIFVIGGEPNGTSEKDRKDDPSLIHILDTAKIKYPSKDEPPRAPKITDEAIPGEEPPRPVQPGEVQQSMRKQIPMSASLDSLARTASPSGSTDRLTQMTQSPPTFPLAAALDAQIVPRQEAPPAPAVVPAPPPEPRPQPMAAIINPAAAADAAAAASAPAASGPPQRPRREGDDQYRRALSPTHNGPVSPDSNMPPRMTSPTGGPSSPPTKNGFSPSVLAARSPSPRMRMADAAAGDRPAPPPDAFYYGRSPVSNGFNDRRPSSVNGTSELEGQLKAKDAELDAGKKREAALKVILARAMQGGYIGEDDDREDQPELSASEEVIRKLTDALVRMKQEKASIQNELVMQMRMASEKTMEADRLRRGALQEAAFYRAKAATLESSSMSELSRIERERIAELEKQLGGLATENANLQQELERTAESAAADKEVHTSALERDSETIRRAEDAEEAHRQVLEELEQLRATSAMTDASLREHTERLITLSSTAQQREAERDHYRSQLDDAFASRDEQLGLIEQAKEAIAANGSRTAELESLHERSASRVKELESELAEAHAEMESRNREVEAANARMIEVENAYAKSREEADSLRNVTTSRLNELLDSHKEMRADESRAVRGHQEQLRAVEEESKSLRKMLREAGQRLEDAESGVSTHRQKHRDLEISHSALRAEMRAHRTRLLNAQTELAKYKDLHASKDNELRQRDLAVTESETRCTVLRNLLADHGVAVADHELDEAPTPNSRELETKLRDRERANETAQREIEELTKRCQEAEDKVESLGRLVERIKDARSPTAMSMRSPSPTGDSDRKAAEAESHYKEKLAALETDYQTAIKYVKGTEKMLNRMKSELSKQKEANNTLTKEIDALRGRPSEIGSRTRDASGRSTPNGIDMELSRRFNTLQTQHTSLQAELQASRDVLSAREREVDVLRTRVEEAEREVEVLREDLNQAQQRITTLLEMNQPGFHLHSEDEGDDRARRESTASGESEEASMAFDKFTKELKQWERSRSPHGTAADIEDVNSTPGRSAPVKPAPVANGTVKGHKRMSSEYSEDWNQ